MKRSVSIAASFMGMLGSAQAADYNMACAKPGDNRTIEIISPGQVGQTCDVRYIRDAGSNISIPYHADNSSAFCDQKAAEIVTRLTQSGFDCAPVETPTVASAVRELSIPTQIIATVPNASEAEPLLSEPPLAETNIAATPPATSPVTPLATSPASRLQAPLPTPAVEADIETEAPAVLEEKMNAILGQPSVSGEVEEGPQAVRGPAQLADRALEPIPSGQTVSTSSLGRLVGAAPSEPAFPVDTASTTTTGVTPVTQAALSNVSPEPSLSATTEVAEAPVATSTASAETPVAQTTLASTTPAPVLREKAPQMSRTPEEIILATLNAQSAAWNEGNMDAFMEAYWRSDELKFVSGNVVTQGYSSVQKKYREEYGNSGDLGFLQLDKTDFVQVTDDVAVVTGRFNLAKGGDDSAGTFSLVMKRVDGMWRIAHDHSTQDSITDQ